MSAFSLARFRSASLSVTPNHLVEKSHGDLLTPPPNLEMNLSAVTLGRKQYATAFVVTKVRSPVTLIGGAPFGCGITKMLSVGILRADHRIFRLGVQPDRSGELAVIHPMA